MNDYIVLTCLIIVLISYHLIFKNKLMKWEKRDMVEKSYSIKFTIIIVVGIMLLIFKILKS